MFWPCNQESASKPKVYLHPRGGRSSSANKFTAALILKILGIKNFSFDCAHHSLAPKPIKGVRSRPFIIRLHYHAQKETMAGLAKGKSILSFRGRQYRFLTNLTCLQRKVSYRVLLVPQSED